MSYYNVPERPLDPPEDKHKVVYRCRLCDGEIREGDDYYDIPDRGPCCEACIDDSKRYDAELEYPEPDFD
jgi:hypothetical protein